MRIPKDVTNDATNLKIYLDDKIVNHNVTDGSDLWIIRLKYLHGTHMVVVDIVELSTNLTLIVAVVAIVTIIIVTAIILLRRRNTKYKKAPKKKSTPSTKILRR